MNLDNVDHSPVNNGGVMWFCFDCMGPASKIIKNISSLYKKQEELEDELKQTNAKLGSVEFEVRRSMSDLDGKVCDNKHEIVNLQQQLSDVNVKLQSVQDELQMKHECPQWSDIVNKAVETKFETVISGTKYGREINRRDKKEGI